MVVYNELTRLSGCGFCGAEDAGVAPVLPPDENEYAIAPDPATQVLAPKSAFDTQTAAAKTRYSWMLGVGVGVVALGVIAAAWAISKRV